MDTKDLEKRISKTYNIVSYWKEGKLVGRKCTKCGEDKEITEFGYRNKQKGTHMNICKQCEKDKTQKWYSENIERAKQIRKKWKEKNKERVKESTKEYQEKNKEKIKEASKKWRKDNPNKAKESSRKWRENNRDYAKELSKQWRENNKQNNLQYISSIVEQINPIFKQLNLPTYGYIYKFENSKTGRCYIGQTIHPLKVRYNRNNTIQSWIKERLDKDTQKFTDELIEEDIILTELFDVACCQYHLNVLETYWINYYDSYNNGYNNTIGNHITDDGIEEFNQILSDHNLEFKDGKLIQIKAPTNR